MESELHRFSFDFLVMSVKLSVSLVRVGAFLKKQDEGNAGECAGGAKPSVRPISAYAIAIHGTGPLKLPTQMAVSWRAVADARQGGGAARLYSMGAILGVPARISEPRCKQNSLQHDRSHWDARTRAHNRAGRCSLAKRARPAAGIRQQLRRRLKGSLRRRFLRRSTLECPCVSA